VKEKREPVFKTNNGHTDEVIMAAFQTKQLGATDWGWEYHRVVPRSAENPEGYDQVWVIEKDGEGAATTGNITG
jgi:hypothetical protein